MKSNTGPRGGCTTVIIPFLAMIALGLLLSGCASMPPASVMGGECRVFDDPGFAVRGKRLKDSRWIGRTQEKGITVCKWKRPKSI